MMTRHSNDTPVGHPGTVLLEEFMKPHGISNYRLAKSLGLSATHVRDLVHGTRPITIATALRLSTYFGNSAQFWIDLQTDNDLENARARIADDLARIKPLSART